jgi:hypothetical protein
VSSTDDAASRRSHLIAAALSSLVPERDRASSTSSSFPGGAIVHTSAGSHVWLDEQPARAISVAMLLASRAGSSSVRIVVRSDLDAEIGITARRARLWRVPATVERLVGSVAAPVMPAAHRAEGILPESHEQFAAVIAESGAQVVSEHGVLTGEVDGLEVCRVVDDGDGPRLEVGVGSHDREAFQMLHGETPAADSLTRIVASVAALRAPDADPHPLNRLAPERQLRQRIIAAPSLVGAATAFGVPGVLPAPGPGHPAPAHLVVRRNDEHVLVACTTGTDLGAMADALDTFDWHRDRYELTSLVVAVPVRNQLRAIDDLTSLAGVPATVVGVPDRK